MIPIASESRIFTIRKGTDFYRSADLNIQVHELERYQLLQERNTKYQINTRSALFTHIKSIWQLSWEGSGREVLLHAVIQGARPPPSCGSTILQSLGAFSTQSGDGEEGECVVFMSRAGKQEASLPTTLLLLELGHTATAN